MQTPIDLRLARHGAILLLLGLLIGFVIGLFHNPHLGNVAHLIGLIGGFGMIALSPLWPRLNLGRSWSNAGAWMMVASMYLSWLGATSAGAFAGGPWGRMGGIELTIGAFLSLFATLVALMGLRELAAPAETKNAMPVAVATKC